ncbi:MAG: DUF3943 domain-containing protein [Deltaproteobacteria bacterium]|nr:DUF3943 domain-containing protein [Deltaproteobacteria bacterium]
MAVAITLFAVRAASSAPNDVPAPRPAPSWVEPTVATGVVVIGMRVSESILWPDAFDPLPVERNAATFVDSLSTTPEFDASERPFEWDRDPWQLNAIGHGVMGSELYLRYRRARHPWWTAAFMAAAWTVVWEYGVEGWHKRPSGIDLAWTPTAGSLLGEARWWMLSRLRGLPRSAGRTLALFLFDPVGELEDRVLGL